MNPHRPNFNEENPPALSAYFRPAAANLPKRFYKLAPGGRWYRQSITGSYMRIKTKSAVIRLQNALNAKVVRPE